MPRMSRYTRARSPAAGRLIWVRLVAVTVLAVFASGTAAAQTTAPAPQPAPPLEAGDTAPAPGAPPAPEVISPLGPAVAPAPTTLEAPLVTSTSPIPPPPPRPVPFYRRDWFWGAVSVVVLTGIVVLAVSLSNADPVTPTTRLGDMRAF
jgi:hypothetical protein